MGHMTWSGTPENYTILFKHAEYRRWDAKDISWAMHRLALGHPYSTVLPEIDIEVWKRESMPKIHGH